MTDTSLSDYARVERAIRYLDAHRASQPSLADVAGHVGLSESHFQRLFTRWAGISPKRFIQHQTAELLTSLIRNETSVLDATYEAGLSGPSRAHDLVLNAEAVTPGDVARAGEGLRIAYGFHPTPFGECLIAITPHGICHLAFVQPVSRAAAVARLRHDWPRATLVADQRATSASAVRAFPGPGARATPGLSIHVKGTNFQLKVWRALLAVPDGGVTTYGSLAAAIAEPGASRAVGNAVGRNPVSWLIPCHRVLRSTGALGGYAWGPDRKRVMLAWEQLRDGPTRRGRSATTPPAVLRASASGAPHARTA
ncbi:MAG: bifunctional helix-turn-helix domain-containing protein/methylated-DNA--[protein]-cysteine S-methyltransferase [Gemmatimonadetes bacterium]|nr:bifunctional helix-turn-helix domain-containing protein/methylated-DNA--[protein]-cysteine S-methyltransferase [Gemmatimonadota bacterium]